MHLSKLIHYTLKMNAFGAYKLYCNKVDLKNPSWSSFQRHQLVGWKTFNKLTTTVGGNLFPPNSLVEVLTPSTSECGYMWIWGLQRVIMLKHSALGWALMQHDCCPYKKTETERQRERGRERPGMFAHKWKAMWRQRRWPSAGQGKKPQEKPILPTTWSWPSSLQSYQKIIFCCLSQWVDGIFLMTARANQYISKYINI